MKHNLLLLLLFCVTTLSAQSDRWQQAVKYEIKADVDVEKYQYEGKQKLEYTNNSPDTLDKVFYHLFFNAFQPGSMMDQKSQSVMDPDSRVMDRISKLSPEEYGYIKVSELKQDGKKCKYITEGTILEVVLDKPLMPGKKTKLEMKYDAQIPQQIRRSGRNNKEGISLSMSQWYPKLCEYDYQGWHAHPYIGREFHGVWGDFKVEIKIDGKYIVGASGEIQNADKVGYNYDTEGIVKNKKKLTWKFEANNVHDFVWAADPDYTHTKYKTTEGVTMHFLYQENDKTKENWEQLPTIMEEALRYMNKRYGKYPYPIYSFIQGGDGGMEYPMATLITGERSLTSLVGVSIHEWMHSWYQMVLATNEALYPWMDEGFTSFGSAEVMNHLRKMNLVPGISVADPHYRTVRGFANFALSGYEEPLITHADHYITNQAYGVASYNKGAVMLKQLDYIMGTDKFYEGFKRYYEQWKFKHPNPNDFIRVMEKTSGLELDWFREYWVNTTHTIDYGVDSIYARGKSSVIKLSKVGYMPMPIDLSVVLEDDTEVKYNIPLRMMRGEKTEEIAQMGMTVAKDWPWTQAVYELKVDIPFSKIKSINIDRSGRMCDVNLDNNTYPKMPEEK